MRHIVSRFITESGFIAGGIRFVEGAPHQAPSHVEFRVDLAEVVRLTSTLRPQIALDDYGWLGAHQNADGIKGVGIRRLDYCTPAWERWYKHTVTEEQYQRWLVFVLSQIGKGYDTCNIPGIALNVDWHNREKWICSEYYTAGLLEAGVPFLNVQRDCCYRIDPDKAHLSGTLIGNCIYHAEGGKVLMPLHPEFGGAVLAEIR